jgi:hypothetical protein
MVLGYRSHFSPVWAPFFDSDPEQFSTVYAPVYSALSEAFPDEEEPRDRVELVLLHGGMCQLQTVGAKVKELFPNARVDETPDTMNSVARGAAIYHTILAGGESSTFGDIRMRRQPVFETVYLEQYRQPFSELVPKTAIPGGEGEIEWPAPPGYPSRLPISLYHGFRADDPFMTLDQELAIEFEIPPKPGQPIHLGWEVLDDRTIEYWWSLDEGPRRRLRRVASQGRDIAREQDFVSQSELLDSLDIR